MNWTELLTSEAEYTYSVTLRLMKMVSDSELGWKPATGNNWMTTGQLLMHITTACGMCCKGFITGDWGMPDDFDPENKPEEAMLPTAEQLPTVSSVQEAIDLLEKDRDTALEMIKSCSNEQFEEVIAAPWDPTEKKLGQHLLMMTQHLAQHKAQLFYYMKLQGKNVSTHNLW